MKSFRTFLNEDQHSNIEFLDSLGLYEINDLFVKALTEGSPDLDYIKQLLAFNADVNIKFDISTSDKSATPLILASKTNNIELLELLLQYDSNLEIMTDNDQGTNFAALHYAVFNNNPRIALALLRAGANPNRRQHSRRSFFPLECLWMRDTKDKGRAEMCKLLLSYGADPNPKEYFDMFPPLHQAVIHRDPNTIRALLEYGADRSRKDIIQNGTAWQLADAVLRSEVPELNPYYQEPQS